MTGIEAHYMYMNALKVSPFAKDIYLTKGESLMQKKRVFRGRPVKQLLATDQKSHGSILHYNARVSRQRIKDNFLHVMAHPPVRENQESQLFKQFRTSYDKNVRDLNQFASKRTAVSGRELRGLARNVHKTRQLAESLQRETSDQTKTAWRRGGVIDKNYCGNINLIKKGSLVYVPERQSWQPRHVNFAKRMWRALATKTNRGYRHYTDKASRDFAKRIGDYYGVKIAKETFQSHGLNYDDFLAPHKKVSMGSSLMGGLAAEAASRFSTEPRRSSIQSILSRVGHRYGSSMASLSKNLSLDEKSILKLRHEIFIHHLKLSLHDTSEKQLQKTPEQLFSASMRATLAMNDDTARHYRQEVYDIEHGANFFNTALREGSRQDIVERGLSLTRTLREAAVRPVINSDKGSADTINLYRRTAMHPLGSLSKKDAKELYGSLSSVSSMRLLSALILAHEDVEDDSFAYDDKITKNLTQPSRHENKIEADKELKILQDGKQKVMETAANFLSLRDVWLDMMQQTGQRADIHPERINDDMNTLHAFMGDARRSYEAAQDGGDEALTTERAIQSLAGGKPAIAENLRYYLDELESF